VIFVDSSVWMDFLRNKSTPLDRNHALIATQCHVDGFALLHSDRDFDPFGRHLRLSVVHC